MSVIMFSRNFSLINVFVPLTIINPSSSHRFGSKECQMVWFCQDIQQFMTWTEN